jgi:hypothetical protein
VLNGQKCRNYLYLHQRFRAHGESEVYFLLSIQLKNCFALKNELCYMEFNADQVQ